MSQEENIRIWKINGQEFEFDLADADVLEGMLKAFETVDEEQKELQKTGATVSFVRDYCNIYYRMFDNLFGPGAGDKIFGGKHNIRVCEETADDFIAFANRQVEKVNQRRNAKNQKYYPGKNQKNKSKYYGNRR